MKSLRTIRPESKPDEQVRDSRQPAGAGGAPSDISTSGRREQRSPLPGSSAGWRLPSGQLLVEYAIQTCFTGSPFNRSPFQAEKETQTEHIPAATSEDESPVTQGIRRLHAAVDRESPEASTPAHKRTATGRSGKGRSRS